MTILPELFQPFHLRATPARIWAMRLRKLNSAYPYRLTETVSATANSQTAMPESTRVVDFAAPDRSHMKWSGGRGGDIEPISIGEKHYWFADGKWSAGTLAVIHGIKSQ